MGIEWFKKWEVAEAMEEIQNDLQHLALVLNIKMNIIINHPIINMNLSL
jgi:hypothetical protein